MFYQWKYHQWQRYIAPSHFLNLHNLGTGKEITNEHEMNSIGIRCIHRLNRMLFLSHLFPFLS